MMLMGELEGLSWRRWIFLKVVGPGVKRPALHLIDDEEARNKVLRAIQDGRDIKRICR